MKTKVFEIAGILFCGMMMLPLHSVAGDSTLGMRYIPAPFDTTLYENDAIRNNLGICTYLGDTARAGDRETLMGVRDSMAGEAGDYVPPLQVGEWIKYGPFTLGDGTIYLVEFWATWCPHCANAVSYLTNIQHTYGSSGVQVVAISMESAATVRSYVEQRGDAMDYAVAVDNYSATFLAYDAIYDITGVPHVFLVDGEGKFVWRGHPADPALIAQLEAITQSEGEGEGEIEGEIPEGEDENQYHPADLDADSRIVMDEAVAYLAAWQNGINPLPYAIRAAYLWQEGETYIYSPEAEPPLSWIPAR